MAISTIWRKLKNGAARKSAVIDVKSKSQLASKRLSETGIDEYKVELFFADLPVKIALVPVPTPPPSPPKAKINGVDRRVSDTTSPASTLLTSSITKSDLTATEVTTVSVPSSPVDGASCEDEQDTKSRESTLDVGTRSSLGSMLDWRGPLSPGDGTSLGDDKRESTLDRGTRLSRNTQELRASSPTIRIDSNTTEKGDEAVKYSTVSLSQKKKQKFQAKQLEDDENRSSPSPSSTPPLPPRPSAYNVDTCSIDLSMDSCPLDSNRVRFDLDQSKGLKMDDQLGENCLRCDQQLSTRRKSAESTTGPIYHVLERPLLCQSCLKRDRHISQLHVTEQTGGLSPPPLPPKDLSNSSNSSFSSSSKYPLYERVDAFGHDREIEKQDSRKVPPLSLSLRGSSSSDYESIPSFTSLLTSHIKDKRSRSLTDPYRRDSSSDYESIPSFLGKSNISSSQNKGIDRKNSGTFHDYETIESMLGQNPQDYIHIQSTESANPDSPTSIPERTRRSKLLKVDSQGYASILPQEIDNSWEFDCLNQEDKDQKDDPSNDHSSLTVHDVEDAWKLQLERGYAPLTLQRKPSPSQNLYWHVNLGQKFVRTKSQPQDYEVPVQALQAIPPPLIVKSELKRQRAISKGDTGNSTSSLSSIAEEERLPLKQQEEAEEIDSAFDNFNDHGSNSSLKKQTSVKMLYIPNASPMSVCLNPSPVPSNRISSVGSGIKTEKPTQRTRFMTVPLVASEK